MCEIAKAPTFQLTSVIWISKGDAGKASGSL